MEPFTQFTGLVAAMDRVNVDTDQIIPKQFLKRIERSGFGEFLFYDWRRLENGEPNPEFELNQDRFNGASILVAGNNFGCGSSREHAPWALLDYGFKVIIAPSYADIFYNNCFKNGILPIRLPQETVDQLFEKIANQEGYQLSVDLQACKIKDNSGMEIDFEVDAYRRECLLKGLDDIGVTLQFNDKIADFEKQRPFYYETKQSS